MLQMVYMIVIFIIVIFTCNLYTHVVIKKFSQITNTIPAQHN